MGFSFNWAGVQVPQANIEGNASVQNRTRADAAAWGNAARGYVTDRGNREYADMISGARQAEDPRIMAIEAEISKLEARNAELQKMQEAQAAQQAAVANYAPSPATLASRQMQGYGGFQQYMQGLQQNQPAQAGPILTMLADNYRRTR